MNTFQPSSVPYTEFSGKGDPWIHLGWIITMQDNMLARVALSLADVDPSCRPLAPCSLPVVLYPCGNVLTNEDMAFSRDALHWGLRCLAGGCPFTVSFLGAGRVWSSTVQPDWLYQRLHMEQAEVVAEIRTTFTRISKEDNVERYYIKCSLPCMPTVMVAKDWVLTGAEFVGYASPWTLCVHPLGLDEIPAIHWCSRNFDFNCEHVERCNLQIPCVRGDFLESATFLPLSLESSPSSPLTLE